MAQEQEKAVSQDVQNQLDAAGLSIDQAKAEAARLGVDLTDPQSAAARARQLGIPESEIQEALESYSQQKPEKSTGETVQERFESNEQAVQVEEQPEQEVPAATAGSSTPELPYFGYKLFQDIPTAFQPSETGPVDEGYLIGPGDQLRLIVWGVTEFQYEFTVDRGGRILIPRAGQWTIANKTLASARKELKRFLSRKYQGLVSDPPTIFMDLTITRLRPIRIFVLGEVARPGGYTVSSFSTVFNVLYSVGGPLTRGSLRNIQLIRDGRVIETIDLYSYLLKGYEKGGRRLQNNDNIFIPLRGKTVSIQGQVRRSGIYELDRKEGLKELIDFAGGLKPTAYTRRYQIERIMPFEERTNPSFARTVIDDSLDKILNGESNPPLQDGDRVRVFSILDPLKNTVSVSGAIHQPGTYELTAKLMTVADLVELADGLSGEAYHERADLVRVLPDGTRRLLPVNLQDALEKDSTANISLQADDHLQIYSIHDLERLNHVSISGKVRNPGDMVLLDSMDVYDLLFRGGGLTDPEFLKEVYLDRADLLRVEPDGIGFRRIPFNLAAALQGGPEGTVLLEPGDQIHVYPVDVQAFRDKSVIIRGAVKNPGVFPWSHEMNLTDLILAAGGVKANAFLKTIEISRHRLDGKKDQRREDYEKILFPFSERENPEELNFALAAGDKDIRRASEFLLQPQDIVSVRTSYREKGARTVAVEGEVIFPGQYTILREDEHLSEIIERAGGLTELAYPEAGRFYRAERRVISNLDAAIKGRAKDDLIVHGGDRIEIPSKPNTITIRGNVQLPGLIKYRQGMRSKTYLRMAGGIQDQTEKILLTYPNGETRELKRFLGVQWRNPKVEDGSEITVIRKPEKDDSQKVDVSQVMVDTMTILTSALTIIVLVQKL